MVFWSGNRNSNLMSIPSLTELLHACHVLSRLSRNAKFKNLVLTWKKLYTISDPVRIRGRVREEPRVRPGYGKTHRCWICIIEDSPSCHSRMFLSGIQHEEENRRKDTRFPLPVLHFHEGKFCKDKSHGNDNLNLPWFFAEENQAIFCRIMFSLVLLSGHPELKVMGLAPMAAAPEHQRMGYRVSACARRAKTVQKTSYGAVVVLGTLRVTALALVSRLLRVST